MAIGHRTAGGAFKRTGQHVTNNRVGYFMSNLEEGLRWLDQAEADFKTARDCLNDGNYYACAFFAQRSAEKALKGLLYSKGYRALITHSVTELLEEASKSRENSEDLAITEGNLIDTISVQDTPTFIQKDPHTSITRRK